MRRGQLNVNSNRGCVESSANSKRSPSAQLEAHRSTRVASQKPRAAKKWRRVANVAGAVEGECVEGSRARPQPRTLTHKRIKDN